MPMEFKQLPLNFKRGNEKLQRMFQRELKLSALRMEGRSKNVPFSRFKNQTGRLRQSIRGIFDPSGPSASLQAGGGSGNVNYAAEVEFGKGGRKGKFFLSRSVDVEDKSLGEKFRGMLKVALSDRI